MIKKISLTTIYVALLCFVLSNPAFAVANPASKIEQGLQQVQAFLTGLIVAVGICAGVWIVIKKLPGIDDPMVK
ncbi:TrbC/VirB2 family protein, partial [Staphylococcus pseudintermedius]|nr:TrbC/VirB2 family protein [Staphylococcus pseudintermedius]